MPNLDAKQTRRNAITSGAMTVAGVSVIGAACGPGTSPAAPQAAKTLPAEITWMGWSMGQEFLLPAYEEAANSFSEKHPDSKITLAPAGGNYREKYTTLIASGTPPDVADVHWQRHVRDAGAGGLTMDLTTYLKVDAYPKDYVGWEPYAWKGKQYGVPWAVQSTGLFYNKSLFDEAGLGYPSENWTWDQFVETAQRLTKPGPDEDSTVWGAGDQGGRNHGWINGLLFAFGGALFSPDFATVRLNEPKSLQAVEFRAAWGPRLKIARNVPTGTSGLFHQGKAAMVTSGSWYVASVKGNAQSALTTGQIPWDVAPVPRGPARHGGLTHELGIGIPTGVTNPDASWIALRHLTSPAGLLPFAHLGRTIPPQKSLWKETIPTDGTPPGFKKTFLDQWEKLNVMSPFTPRFNDIVPIWEEEMDPVWTGQRPARDGVAAASSRMQDFLRQLKSEGLL
ncbi:MAG TPA: sugar ABC transporter substrate-binding protein [Chloroflexota bacterium]|nr:sugar ABC transporter substrate-binding protein [Chloroflexota bacterium]